MPRIRVAGFNKHHRHRRLSSAGAGSRRFLRCPTMLWSTGQRCIAAAFVDVDTMATVLADEISGALLGILALRADVSAAAAFVVGGC